jgi:hypothetical protein
MKQGSWLSVGSLFVEPADRQREMVIYIKPPDRAQIIIL